jgi:hypothetical protein
MKLSTPGRPAEYGRTGAQRPVHATQHRKAGRPLEIRRVTDRNAEHAEIGAHGLTERELRSTPACASLRRHGIW